MKKVSVKIIVSALILALMLAFAGCGGPSTIEEYVNSSEEAQKEIADIEKSSDIQVDIKDNTITFTYKMDQTYTKDQVKAIKKEMEKQLPDMEKSLDSSIKELKDDSGIDDITMSMKFLNGDGSEIYAKDFN